MRKPLALIASLILLSPTFANDCREEKRSFKVKSTDKDAKVYYQVNIDGDKREVLLCNENEVCLEIYEKGFLRGDKAFNEKKNGLIRRQRSKSLSTFAGSIMTVSFGSLAIHSLLKANKAVGSILAVYAGATAGIAYVGNGAKKGLEKVSTMMDILQNNSCGDVAVKMDDEDLKAIASKIVGENEQDYGVAGMFTSALKKRVDSSRTRAGEMDERFAKVEERIANISRHMKKENIMNDEFLRSAYERKVNQITNRR